MGRQTKASIALDKACGRIVVSAVAMEFAVPNFIMESPRGGSSDVIYARQISMYLLGCVFNISKQRIGTVFGRHYSTVSHACRLIEQDREDPVLDAKLLKLENFLRQTPTSLSAASF